MKCPFRTCTTKQGENTTNYEVDQEYKDCYETSCMAFITNEKKCKLIESKLIDNKVMEKEY